MYTIQDVRDAHQMWEYKIKNAGREGIVLKDDKPGWINRLLKVVTRETPSKGSTSGSNLKKGYQPV